MNQIRILYLVVGALVFASAGASAHASNDPDWFVRAVHKGDFAGIRAKVAQGYPLENGQDNIFSAVSISVPTVIFYYRDRSMVDALFEAIGTVPTALIHHERTVLAFKAAIYYRQFYFAQRLVGAGFRLDRVFPFDNMTLLHLPVARKIDGGWERTNSVLGFLGRGFFDPSDSEAATSAMQLLEFLEYLETKRAYAPTDSEITQALANLPLSMGRAGTPPALEAALERAFGRFVARAPLAKVSDCALISIAAGASWSETVFNQLVRYLDAGLVTSRVLNPRPTETECRGGVYDSAFANARGLDRVSLLRAALEGYVLNWGRMWRDGNGGRLIPRGNLRAARELVRRGARIDAIVTDQVFDNYDREILDFKLPYQYLFIQDKEPPAIDLALLEMFLENGASFELDRQNTFAQLVARRLGQHRAGDFYLKALGNVLARGRPLEINLFDTLANGEVESLPTASMQDLRTEALALFSWAKQHAPSSVHRVLSSNVWLFMANSWPRETVRWMFDHHDEGGSVEQFTRNVKNRFQAYCDAKGDQADSCEYWARQVFKKYGI